MADGEELPVRECVLRRRVLDLGFDCDEGSCLFWSQVGPDDAEPQCAIEYFGLLGEAGRELADWLLGLKTRAQVLAVLGSEWQAEPVE
jgi:hypothetical protein